MAEGSKEGNGRLDDTVLTQLEAQEFLFSNANFEEASIQEGHLLYQCKPVFKLNR